MKLVKMIVAASILGIVPLVALVSMMHRKPSRNKTPKKPQIVSVTRSMEDKR